MHTFSETLKRLRDERGLSQKGLAGALNLTRFTISNYEAGRREPDFATLRSIAAFFGCTSDYLLGTERPGEKGGEADERLEELIGGFYNLTPSERGYAVLLFGDMLNNLSRLQGLPDYRRSLLRSVFGMCMSANALGATLAGLAEGKPGNAEVYRRLIQRSYELKASMFISADGMQAAFLRETESVAAKAGVKIETRDGPAPFPGFMDGSLEEFFDWAEEY